MNDPVAAGDFGRLMQYGAVGVIATGLLTLVVLLFRRFVEHAIESNKKLQEQNTTMQREFLGALHSMKTEHTSTLNTMKTEFISEIRELHRAVATVVNDMPSGPMRVRQFKPRGGGGGGG